MEVDYRRIAAAATSFAWVRLLIEALIRERLLLISDGENRSTEDRLTKNALRIIEIR